MPSTDLAKRTTLVLGLCLAAAVGACGDADAPGGTGGPGSTGSGATGIAPRAPVNTTSPAANAKLPDVPRLDTATAEAAARVDEDAAATDSVAMVALMDLSERGDHKEAVRIAREQLLTRDGDEYADPYVAAIGLEVLLAAGEAGAVKQALELAEWFLAAEDPQVSGDVVSMLARVEGSDRERAEALLARIAQVGDDPDDALSAVYVLAERKGGAHLDTLAEIARNAERLEGLRAAAAAGLLHAGDARAEAILRGLGTGPDADLIDVISSLSVRGARGVLPHVQRLVERAIARGDAAAEVDAACWALADAFAGGDGAPARTAIGGWLARDANYDGDSAAYALWMLGDESRAGDVRRILVREIVSQGSHDVELAVLLLDEIGERGLATDERFRDAVDAAAQASVPAGSDPIAASRLQFLKIAAANAYLRSTKR